MHICIYIYTYIYTYTQIHTEDSNSEVEESGGNSRAPHRLIHRHFSAFFVEPRWHLPKIDNTPLTLNEEDTTHSEWGRHHSLWLRQTPHTLIEARPAWGRSQSSEAGRASFRGSGVWDLPQTSRANPAKCMLCIASIAKATNGCALVPSWLNEKRAEVSVNTFVFCSVCKYFHMLKCLWILL